MKIMPNIEAICPTVLMFLFMSAFLRTSVMLQAPFKSLP